MKTIIAAVAVLAAAGNAHAASCYRHIYNQSGAPWTFSANPTQYGNVWFLTGGDKHRHGERKDGPGCISKNGPCTLAAGVTVEIQYTQQAGYSTGVMNITDSTGYGLGWTYSNSYLDCPRIQHDGNTGAVSMNDPADGDYSVGANSWNGFKSPPAKLPPPRKPHRR